MSRKRQLTATQKNINKINDNLRSIAKVFGTNSKPYEQAAQRLHGHDFELYDKNGVIQIKNNAANRAKHQTIRSITNKRQSVQILKRTYAPKDKKSISVGNIPENEYDFWAWYSGLSEDFEDLYDEIYNNLDPACEICDIHLDKFTAFDDESYRIAKWQEVFEKIMNDTRAAKEFYDTFKYGVDPSTGESTTYTDQDYQVTPGYEGMFDMSWFKED